MHANTQATENTRVAVAPGSGEKKDAKSEGKKDPKPEDPKTDEGEDDAAAGGAEDTDGPGAGDAGEEVVAKGPGTEEGRKNARVDGAGPGDGGGEDAREMALRVHQIWRKAQRAQREQVAQHTKRDDKY